MARKRGETGEFVEAITLDDVRGVFESVEGPIVTSGDIADALDCTTQTARRKLKQLREQGVVGSRLAGRTTVWWLTDEASEAPASPLKQITGLLTDEEADRAEARQREWRESFEAEISGEHGQ